MNFAELCRTTLKVNSTSAEMKYLFLKILRNLCWQERPAAGKNKNCLSLLRIFHFLK